MEAYIEDERVFAFHGKVCSYDHSWVRFASFTAMLVEAIFSHDASLLRVGHVPGQDFEG